MEFTEEVNAMISIGTLIMLVGTAFGVFYRLKFTTEQLKAANERQNEQIDKNSRSSQKANDSVSEIKTQLITDRHLSEEANARLESKVDMQGAQITNITEQGKARDEFLAKIFDKLNSLEGGKV